MSHTELLPVSGEYQEFNGRTEASPPPTPLLSFLFPFIAGAKLINMAMRKAFHVLQRSWLEEVDSSLVSRKRSISFFINILE